MSLKRLTPLLWLVIGALGMTIATELLISNAWLAGYVVREYCASVDEGRRLALREAVDQAAAPHSIHIHCDD